MIRGEEGNQRKELQKLVDWLLDEVKPDVIHLSNLMLMGMARQFSREFGPPVVCSLAGEDAFLQRLVSPYREQMQQHMRERAADVDAFVSLNRYYADAMTDYLELDPNKVHVIPHGLKLDGHGTRPGSENGKPMVVGCLARVCEDKGTHLLLEACERLAEDPTVPPFEVRIAGYLGTAEREYLQQLENRAAAGKLAGRFRYHGELDRNEKITFLQSLDVFCLPTVHPEAKGLPVLEAMANAVPVVLPAHGSFPEMIEDTGGGVLCQPLDTAHVAECLAELLRDPARAAELGRAGQAAIRDRYHAEIMARRTRELYARLIEQQSAAAG
jgi:glycosyltransferase involved in cell wall biosynthesis